MQMPALYLPLRSGLWFLPIVLFLLTVFLCVIFFILVMVSTIVIFQSDKERRERVLHCTTEKAHAKSEQSLLLGSTHAIKTSTTLHAQRPPQAS